MSLSGIDWKDITKRLTLYAHTCIHRKSWAEAEDIAQNTIVAFYDGGSATWDREKHPDVFDHLAMVVRDGTSNRRRLKSRRKTDLVDEEVLDAHEASTKSPEDELAEHDELAAVVSDLAKDFAKDGDCLELLGCFEDGIDGAQEQAEKTGFRIERIRNARKRFFRVSGALRKKHDGGER